MTDIIEQAARISYESQALYRKGGREWSEASEALRERHRESMRALAAAGLLSPRTITPEQRTHIEVRATFTYGVNTVRSTGVMKDMGDLGAKVDSLREQACLDTQGLVDLRKVETRTVTTAETPWIEVSR